MTSEQLREWMNEAGLTCGQLADILGKSPGYISNVRRGFNPISDNLKKALIKAYPYDRRLAAILGVEVDCSHCHGGLVDSDDEYNEPIYCQFCETGLILELARIRYKLAGLEMALDNCDGDKRMADHKVWLMLNIRQFREVYALTARSLRELET